MPDLWDLANAVPDALAELLAAARAAAGEPTNLAVKATAPPTKSPTTAKKTTSRKTAAKSATARKTTNASPARKSTAKKTAG